MIKIFGHFSPDTDATGSAILWAWYIKNHRAMDTKPFVLGTLNKETQFVLKKWGLSEPELLEKIEKGDEVMIVDTNNPEEVFENINDANILQIIDHHKLFGGLKTNSPIDVKLSPLASTASVIFELMNIEAKDLPEDIAGLALSCILSDTLEFRSPTTTAKDRHIASMLSSRLNLDMTEYANKMFEAKSDLSDFTDKGLVHLDSKKIDLGEKKIRISVIETTNPQPVLERKSGILSAISEVIKEEKIDEVMFFIVNILKEEATVFAHNDFIKKIVELSFGVEVKGGEALLPGIVSRKKQILPMLKLPD